MFWFIKRARSVLTLVGFRNCYNCPNNYPDQCPYPSFHRIESFVKENQKMKTVRFRYLCWGKIGLRDCFTFQILRERRVGTKIFNSTRRIWIDESLIFCEVSCESFNRSDQIKVQIGDEVNDSAGCCTCEDPPTMNTIKVLPGSFE